MKHIVYLFLFIMAILLITSPFSANLDKTGTMWAPYLEWEFSNTTFSGNPFDLIATATFTHNGSGKTHITELFYDGDGLWKLRFTGTEIGEWTCQVESGDPELDNHSGTITIEANPNPKIKGFIITQGNKFAIQTSTGDKSGYLYNAFWGAEHHVEPIQSPNYDITLWGDKSYATATAQYVLDRGCNAIAFSMNNQWFEPGALRWDDHSDEDPDHNSFAALDTLITAAHSIGAGCHIWAWGDESRRWTQVGVGGINGVPDKRLQRYIAARLGPLPGWSMGYGFDLGEWVTLDQINAWADFMHQKCGWPHLFWGRNNSGLWGSSHPTQTDGKSYGGLGPRDYNQVVSDLGSDLTRPHIYEERDLYTRSMDMSTTRSQMWIYAMAGGMSGHFGIYWGNGSPDYPNPEQLSTHLKFWENRFLLDMERDNSLTNGYCLKTPDNTNYVFYKQNTGSIEIDLSGLSGTIAASAIDAKLAYAEIDISSDLTKTDQTWTAPYSSDWAVAVGSFNTVPVKKGKLKTQGHSIIVDVHPNPFYTSTVISLKGNSEIQNLKIYNISGKEVGHIDLLQKDGNLLTQYKWNAQAFTPGIFFIRLFGKDGIYTKKLVRLK